MVSLTIKPGEGMSQQAPQSFEATEPPAFKDVVLDMFPTNPVAAMANEEMPNHRLLFGYAVAVRSAGSRMQAFFEDLNDVIMHMWWPSSRAVRRFPPHDNHLHGSGVERNWRLGRQSRQFWCFNWWWSTP